MIPIYLDPNIFTIGPVTLSWHGLFSAIGVLLGVTFGVRLAVSRGVDEDHAYSLAMWSVLGGIVGARLFHVVDAWPYYSQNPVQIIMLTEGGIAIYGAIVGGVLTGTAYVIWRRLSLGHLADAGGVGLILGQAVGRIGDVINGEHHGSPYDGPFSVVYLHPNTLGELGRSVHLAVGYELVWDLALFAVLVATFDCVRRPGVLFWVYFLGYAIGRLALTFFRTDTIVAFGLTQAQIVAAVGIVASIVMLLWLGRRPLTNHVPSPSGRSTRMGREG